MNEAQQLYAAMGARPVINALGNRTLLGGSRPEPEVLEAMQLAGRYYVDMDELLEGSGRIVAQMLECEAALITPGAAAALFMGAAGCITGSDPRKIEQLPDTGGLRDEIVIQKTQRYKYDRVVRLTGARFVEAGDASGTTPDELADAIGPSTAALLYSTVEQPGNFVQIEDAITIAHESGVPVIVDAAFQVYPLDGLTRYTAAGADLVAYGAKYFGAPNSSGILCGRTDRVGAARMHSFASFEKRQILGVGRPLKIDRQEVVGVVTALRRWLDMDHDQRHATAAGRGRRLEGALQGIDSLQLPGDGDDETMATLVVGIDEATLGRSAAAVEAQLLEGNPSIWCSCGDGVLNFSMYTVVDGDEEVIATRLREILQV